MRISRIYALSIQHKSVKTGSKTLNISLISPKEHGQRNADRALLCVYCNPARLAAFYFAFPTMFCHSAIAFK